MLVALRAVACRHYAITERKVFGCPPFFVVQRMMACVYGQQIALKLPQLAVTALLETHGCTFVQPFGRHPMQRWLAFEADSPAFASLEDLFEESLSFVRELPAKE
ncbi:hypothetical protein [Paraburkholderia ultramafica]|uniref:hypothetical protein n=1 Tax=Paraburkholderia ultramafica TaxID=1544867 RepID=UPI0015841B78|nr:hypothetical protein [Paraburkholderia ultramafica]